MNMILGNKTINLIFLGSSKTNSVYLGQNLVWSDEEPPAGDYWGLCFTAEEPNSTVEMKTSGTAPAVNLLYSTDATHWNEFVVGTTSVSLANIGDKVWLKAGEGGNSAMGTSTSNYNSFKLTGKLAASGNIMSLLDGSQETYTISLSNCFNYLFYNISALTKAPDLPATTLTNSCYNGMFTRCIALKTPPLTLPATTLANFCYQSMFNGCSSLTSAPVFSVLDAPTYCCQNMFNGCTSLSSTQIQLQSTSVGTYCYQSMFNGCSSLTQAPALPATTLANFCYNGMFSNCASLTQAPALPATTLANYCYNNMFLNCVSLTAAPILTATTLASYCYSGMLSNCTSLTSAPDLPATTLATYCYLNMFTNCSSLTQAPELPATTLANYCYKGMFSDCTSLTQAPALPATTLANNCYENMFASCTSLTATPYLPAKTTANSCYSGTFMRCSSLSKVETCLTGFTGSHNLAWLNHVSSSGTFYCPSQLGNNATITRDMSHCPVGWTVVNPTVMTYTNNDSKMHNLTGVVSHADLIQAVEDDNHVSAELKAVDFGQDTTSLGVSAFTDWGMVRTVKIGDNMVDIDDNAFRRILNLSSFTWGVGNNLTAIGPYALAGILKIGQWDIPEGVLSIGSNAIIYGSTPLSVINVPSTVTSIGGNAFSNNVGLLSVIFAGKTMPEVEALANYPWGASGKIFVAA